MCLKLSGRRHISNSPTVAKLRPATSNQSCFLCATCHQVCNAGQEPQSLRHCHSDDPAKPNAKLVPIRFHSRGHGFLVMVMRRPAAVNWQAYRIFRYLCLLSNYIWQVWVRSKPSPEPLQPQLRAGSNVAQAIAECLRPPNRSHKLLDRFRPRFRRLPKSEKAPAAPDGIMSATKPESAPGLRRMVTCLPLRPME